ncbi:hypothetical protein DL96DRAFT_1629963 [Flagelloscypha sp. PMI_526]|nr:hypothetical protein DL96DRAFT_1629963 [Flagelloscypha sp. PMI_526]
MNKMENSKATEVHGLSGEDSHQGEVARVTRGNVKTIVKDSVDDALTGAFKLAISQDTRWKLHSTIVLTPIRDDLSQVKDDMWFTRTSLDDIQNELKQTLNQLNRIEGVSRRVKALDTPKERNLASINVRQEYSNRDGIGGRQRAINCSFMPLTPIPRSHSSTTMAISLPPMNAAGIPLPDPPSDPPVILDVEKANEYLRELKDNSRLAVDEPRVTGTDIAEAYVYRFKLCRGVADQGDPAV